MQPETSILIGLAITSSLSLLVVLYLRARLRRILVDLCGTAERADFWTGFSNVVLVLTPAIFALFPSPSFALFRSPSDAAVSLTADLISQIRWSLVGLVTAVVLLGLVLGLSIPKEQKRTTP